MSVGLQVNRNVKGGAAEDVGTHSSLASSRNRGFPIGHSQSHIGSGTLVSCAQVFVGGARRSINAVVIVYDH